MTLRDALLEQIYALPIADRLEIRAALDESVERDLADQDMKDESVTDWSVVRERLEAELLRGLDSGPLRLVDEHYWQELQGRIERRRTSAS